MVTDTDSETKHKPADLSLASYSIYLRDGRVLTVDADKVTPTPGLLTMYRADQIIAQFQIRELIGYAKI